MGTREDLSRLAAGLDLSDSDDRAIFRQRVDHLFRNAKLTALHEAIGDMGGSEFPRERALASRHLSDLYVGR